MWEKIDRHFFFKYPTKRSPLKKNCSKMRLFNYHIWWYMLTKVSPFGKHLLFQINENWFWSVHFFIKKIIIRVMLISRGDHWPLWWRQFILLYLLYINVIFLRNFYTSKEYLFVCLFCFVRVWGGTGGLNIKYLLYINVYSLRNCLVPTYNLFFVAVFEGFLALVFLGWGRSIGYKVLIYCICLFVICFVLLCVCILIAKLLYTQLLLGFSLRFLGRVKAWT